MRTVRLAVLGAALALVAACSSTASGHGSRSGTGSGSPATAGASGSGGGHLGESGSPSGSASSSAPSPPSSSSASSGSGRDWTSGVNFATLSHPDLHCAPAGEGGRVDVLKVVRADVTGDGQLDAIVRVECAHAASEWPDSVYVYSDSSGTPTLVGTLLHQTDSSYAPHINTHGSTVTLTLQAWSTFAAGCCPDLTYRQTFAWSGSSFSAGPKQDVLHACQAEGDSLPLTVHDGGGAAGHAAIILIWQNQLPQACTLTGYPGVDAEPSGGSAIHAQRSDAGLGVHTITLPPGGHASAVLIWATIPSGGSDCTATSSDILVTPANTSATVTADQHVGLCSLQIHPTVAGTGGV